MTAPTRNGSAAAILEVRDLRVYYHTPLGPVKAVDGVSFSLKSGERFGLVGESGSGKSTIALSLLRLHKPPARIEGGKILLDGKDMVAMSDAEVRLTRLATVALIAQGAMNSLNPVIRVQDQIIDGLQDHNEQLSRSELTVRVRELLERVGLKPEVAHMFPHELSGGMKQRVVIAIAISLRPKVIVADEPTSALDVVVQMQVMETLRKVQQELGAAVILVGHDMWLMAQFVDRLGVMYAGKLVEISPVLDIFAVPLHPYSALLIASLPSLTVKSKLQGIPGLPPSLLNRAGGCPFYARCPKAMDVCLAEEPPLRETQPGRWVACHLY
jgi:oligopeptide/dipeptide ABC transporter ATP-binding protein